jgi:hypothetical protein
MQDGSCEISVLEVDLKTLSLCDDRSPRESTGRLISPLDDSEREGPSAADALVPPTTGVFETCPLGAGEGGGEVTVRRTCDALWRKAAPL